MSDAPKAPLLVASGARIAVDGHVVTPAIDLEVAGPKLVIAGDAGPLLALLMNVPLGAATRALAAEASALDPQGVATVAAGSLSLSGRDVGARHHVAHVGAAPFDPPLPQDLTARELVEWSAKLAGLGRLARSRVADALERVGLAKAGPRLIKTLATPEKRALLLAHAAVAGPEVIVAEAPLADLDGDAATFVLTALSRVTEGRAWIVSVARLSPGSPEATLVERADQVLYLSGGETLFSGAPSEVFAKGHRYGLTVRSNAEALKSELLARGLELTGGPERFSVALPEGKETSEILAAAAAARARVVEMLLLM